MFNIKSNAVKQTSIFYAMFYQPVVHNSKRHLESKRNSNVKKDRLLDFQIDKPKWPGQNTDFQAKKQLKGIIRGF